jgi:FtsZ-binding cell division protein ZapB
MGNKELMDCEHVRELLDGYALGAASREEADAVERHIADCLGCWEELGKSQQTAALLAISVPIRPAPPHLEQRVLARIERERVGVREEPRPSFWERFRISWPATAGALGAASVAAILFSSFLQMQVSDLENENNELRADLSSTTFSLERQLSQTDSQLEEQQTIFQVLADNDAREVRAESRGDNEGSFDYVWSPDTGKGYVLCSSLPILTPGKVYQLWVTTPAVDYPVASFRTSDGTCQIAIDLTIFGEAAGLGISIEDTPGGVDKPEDKWELYVRFDDD